LPESIDNATSSSDRCTTPCQSVRQAGNDPRRSASTTKPRLVTKLTSRPLPTSALLAPVPLKGTAPSRQDRAWISHHHKGDGGYFISALMGCRGTTMLGLHYSLFRDFPR